MNRRQELNTTTRRQFLRQGLAGASLLCMPRSLFALYEEQADADANDVVLRFSAFSDVHLKKDPSCVEADRLRRAIKFMYEYSRKQAYAKCDGMLVAGDVSDNGFDEELFLFKKIVDEELKPETTTIYCMGNHEFHRGTKKRWEEIFERDSNKTYEVNGFRFVGLSPEVGVRREDGTHERDYLYALEWFEQQIDEACKADPAKPVFSFQHYHVSPTVYGSRGDDDWGVKDLYETLQKYPRVINFSGHSHYPINDPRSAWQGRFTAFGTGTLSYFEMGGEGGKYNKFPPGYKRAAQMYIVDVRKDNSVVLKPYDLITNSFFDLVYVVAEPGAIDKYIYTDERYKTSIKPKWSGDPKATCVKEFADAAVLTFPQAECPDVVHSYRVDLSKRSGDAWEPQKPQYFWSEYYFKDRPDEMRAELIALDAQTQYRAEIVALNPFFKESGEKLVVEFKTKKDVVDKKAERPIPDMLNLQFKDGKVVNESLNNSGEQKAIETFGAPKIDAYAATFNGDSDRYRIKFTVKDYEKMPQATIAVRFKIDEFPTQHNGVVLGNTQGNGTSLELNLKTKRLEFWAGVNNKYQILETPFEVTKGEFHDAFGVYDGESVVMYFDGKEVARVKAPGKLTHPTWPEDVVAYCVGADITEGGAGANHFKGAIAYAKVYSWALDARQVGALSSDK